MLRIVSKMLVLVVLVGCADFPQLDAAITDGARNTKYPVLQPMNDILAISTDPNGRDIETESKQLQARANNLRKRAATLRGPIISKRLRRQMLEAVERHTG